MPLDVIGAGLAGQVATLALTQAGHAVRLWGTPESTPNRAVALSAPSVAYLSQLCPSVAELGSPIERIHVSRQGRLGRVLLDAQEHDQATFGRVVGNDELSECLDQAINAERRAEPVTSLTLGWQVNGRDSQQVVLAAPVPALLKSAGIEFSNPVIDGQLWVALARGMTGTTAYERFTSTGPLAVLPMGGGLASVVWHVDQPVESIDQVNQALGGRVALSAIAHQAQMPIRLHRAQSLARPGLAVVGNASQFLHPVAGQGFNLILRQIQSLVRHGFAGLGAFQREALADQARWFQTTRLLAQVYQPEIPFQGLALSALQASGVGQSVFVRQFMEGA